MAFGNIYYGCYYVLPAFNPWNPPRKEFLPQVELRSHTEIQSTASRTTLKQIFVNNSNEDVQNVNYSFPLYDGVSVVAFKCTIGKTIIHGIVKERNQAKTEYNEAIARGEKAGLLEQSSSASDVFNSKVGNIAKGEKAIVEIEYVGELKHVAQLDAVCFSIPTAIAPRYDTTGNSFGQNVNSLRQGHIEIVVDVEIDEGTHIEGISSPSHPISITMGRKSTRPNETFKTNRGSATLSLSNAPLEKDFVIAINAQDSGVPHALLEDHPDIPNHRALMTTLVPRFNLPNIHPEIVFIVDRSGSMGGKMPTLIEALKVFLKSLPLTVKFNICSFGSHYHFLFPKSVPYDEGTLDQAMRAVDQFHADFGGTEMFNPIKATVDQRLSVSLPLEIMVLTDGEIWNQQLVFDLVNEASKKNVRLFSLGIGHQASTSLVEGLARAGNGFAQFVKDSEKIDKGAIRMLKAALSPHINDYRLKLIYEHEDIGDDDYEMIADTKLTFKTSETKQKDDIPAKKPISLFDTNFKEDKINQIGRYDHLPTLTPPKELQAPTTIAGLFPFNRLSAYMLLPNCTRPLKSVMLCGTCEGTPVQLDMPIQKVGTAKTIHQLAAKKAMLDVEEGRGWISVAKDVDGTDLKSKYAADWARIVEREAVRLGTTFQIAGKYCSFVAVENDKQEQAKVIHVPEEAPSQQALFQRAAQQAASQQASFQQATQQAQVQAQAPRAASDQIFYRRDRREAPQQTASEVFMKRNQLREIATPQGTSGADFRQSVFGNVRPTSRRMQPSYAPTSHSPSSAGLFGNVNDLQDYTSHPTFGASSNVNHPQTQSAWTGFGNTTMSASGPLLPGAFAPAPAGQKQEYRSSSLFGFGAGNAPPAPKAPGSLFGQNSFQTSPENTSGLFNNDSRKAATTAASILTPTAQLQTNQFNTTSLFGNQAPVNPFTGSSTTSLFTGSASPSASPTTRMHQLINLQRFNGSWTQTDQLLYIANETKTDLDEAFSEIKDDADGSIKATLLAIAWLTIKVSGEKEVWEMIVEKARLWLEGVEALNRVDIDGLLKRAVEAWLA